MQGTPPDGAEASRIDLDEIEHLARASLAAKAALAHEEALERVAGDAVWVELEALREAQRTARMTYLAALPEELVIEMVRRLR